MMLGIFWGRTVMTPTSGAGGGAGGASLEQPARALQAAATAQANLLSKIFHRCILEVPIAQARPSLQNVGRGPSVTSITSQRPKRVDRKSTRLNSSHSCASRMPSSACNKHKRHNAHKNYPTT